MIKLKTLLKENIEATIKPKDLYNFYYLWHIATNSPQDVQSQYGRDVLKHYTSIFKQKYVSIFTQLVYKQIQKYVAQKRIDPDFPINKLTPNSSPDELYVLMKKTFRSDMVRRNDVWILIAEYLYELSKAGDPNSIFLYVDRLNSCVHNTNTTVMEKLPNFYGELYKTFDFIHNAKNIEALKPHVDKDIRDLKNQNNDLNEEVSEQDRQNVEFMTGLKQGVKDKGNGDQRNMSEYPRDWVRGYQSVKKDSTWSKFNDRITQIASSFGNSYGRR